MSTSERSDPLVDLIRSVAEADMARRAAQPRPLRVKPCPRCRGEGKAGPSSHGWTDPEQERDCGLCRGDGEITA